MKNLNKLNNLVKIKEKQINEKKLIKLRMRVNQMFFNEYLSKSEIAKKKKVSRPFVIAWTKSKKQNFTKDDRGWKKGKRRKWNKNIEKKIKNIFQ